jgi:hypothetical protein
MPVSLVHFLAIAALAFLSETDAFQNEVARVGRMPGRCDMCTSFDAHRSRQISFLPKVGEQGPKKKHKTPVYMASSSQDKTTEVSPALSAILEELHLCGFSFRIVVSQKTVKGMQQFGQRAYSLA